jgi:hypothetical protein
VKLSLSTVKDVFSKGFASVREDDTLSSCFSLFKEKMPPVLVVLDSEGKYKGVVSRRWMITSRLDPSIDLHLLWHYIYRNYTEIPNEMNVNRETLYNRALSIASLGSVMHEDYDKKSN